MAELDPLVAEILLKGDNEFISKIREIGTEGAEHFHKLFEEMQKGASQAQLATGTILALATAVGSVVVATSKWINEQNEANVKTIALSEAVGVTAGKIQQLETVFAASGVKADQFQRFMVRLTTTIARDWPQAAEAIKTYATQNDAMTLRVQNASQRVRDAQNAVSDNSRDRTAQMENDNLALEASYIKLQFAAARAASEQANSANSVRNASLGLTAALQRVAELEGRPVSEADKKALELAQARQNVTNAQRALDDARIAQQEKAAGAELKRRQQEQAYDDLARKASKNARDDAEQRIKDENAVKEAIIQKAEAQERADKFAQTNVKSVRDALDGVVSGNKGVASAVDLTKVYGVNMTKSIIAQAAETSKGATPKPYEVLTQLSRTFSAATEEQITKEQRLAIVTRLAGTQMQALGTSASSILGVLEKGGQALADFNVKASSLDTHEGKERVEAFERAVTSLSLSFELLKQRIAVAISPVFTRIIDAINDSLTKSGGYLKGFVEGIAAISEAVGKASTSLGELVDKFTKLFSGGTLGGADVLKSALIGLGVALIAATGPIGAMVVGITLVITAIGTVRDNWDAVKKAVSDAWDKVKDTAVVRFLTSVYEIIKKIVEGLAIIDRATGIKLGNDKGGAAASDSHGDIKGHAAGGKIDGPGTGTSDSVLARLSRGEFVIRAAAVDHFGEGLFHALNSLSAPGFAQGGALPAPVRSGAIAPATSTLNLSIDGRSFNGLRGPKSTIDDLSNFAVSRQASAAGSNPSWVS